MKRAEARIDGRRLLLRELRARDLWTVIGLLRDKEMARFHFVPAGTFSWPRPVRKLMRFLGRCRAYLWAFWQRIRPGATRGQYKLAIVSKETGRLVGIITLTDVFFDKECARIGIWIGRAFWAKGVMYEAEALLIRWAFERLGLERIVGNVHCENVASIITMKKLGYHFVEVSKHAKDNAGKAVDVYIFVLLRERFKAF